jgi:hypothetical protein
MEGEVDQLAVTNDAHMAAYAKEGTALDPALRRLSNRSINDRPEGPGKVFQYD